MRAAGLVVVAAAIVGASACSPSPQATTPIRSHVASRDAGVVDGDARQKLVVVTSDECGMMLDQIYFDDGSAAISAAQMPVVESTATMLTCLERQGAGIRWEVQGYADSTEPNPLDLSDARAKAIRDELGKRGVALSSMSMQGYADSQPIDRGPTPSAHARNRRVQLLVISRATPP